MNYKSRRLFADLGSVRVKSMLVVISVGYLLFCFGIATLILLFSTFFGGLLSGCITLALYRVFDRNLKQYSQAQRMRKYIQALRGREKIQVSDLRPYVNKDVAFIRSDLADMINKGWFLQGHLVDKGKTLIVSNRAYEDYRNNKQDDTLKKEEPIKEKKEKKVETPKQVGKYDHLPKEVRETLLLGDEYLKQLDECNRLIPGIEMSIKISRIENIAGKIFERVSNHPEDVDDIKKLMKYYLPTTIKLLNNYIDMDSQPVQGDNITKSKKDIEDTLDNLNKALEKMLDDMFEETTWDVASDISVLENLLKSDGLTGNDFEKE